MSRPNDPVLCENSADCLSGPPVVVQDPTRPFMPFDIALHVGRGMLRPSRERLRLDPGLETMILAPCAPGQGRPSVEAEQRPLLRPSQG